MGPVNVCERVKGPAASHGGLIATMSDRCLKVGATPSSAAGPNMTMAPVPTVLQVWPVRAGDHVDRHDFGAGDILGPAGAKVRNLVNVRGRRRAPAAVAKPKPEAPLSEFQLSDLLGTDAGMGWGRAFACNAIHARSGDVVSLRCLHGRCLSGHLARDACLAIGAPPLPAQLVGTQDGVVARFDVERGRVVSQIDTKLSTSRSYGCVRRTCALAMGRSCGTGLHALTLAVAAPAASAPTCLAVQRDVLTVGTAKGGCLIYDLRSGERAGTLKLPPCADPLMGEPKCGRRCSVAV